MQWTLGVQFRQTDRSTMQLLTNDIKVRLQNTGRMGRHLAEVRPVVSLQAGPNSQPPVVRSPEGQGVALVRAEGLLADGQNVKVGAVTPKPGNLTQEREEEKKRNE